ncbi:hypothetical protein R3P38DRAFT_3346388 [Favolaschia claudopus]|uniref:BRCT domain-containing protein n=1 Tax=Favolaschia claudopus TaxID=2862362 RepID=A0AAW0D6Y7_9AGAR
MHRRGNKSKKVPNVRLRPAQPDAVARARRSTLPEETNEYDVESQAANTEEAPIASGSCPRPFKGLVICATGNVDKATLSKLASDLGAASISVFTDRVTHLIAEEHGGSKYSCAMERRIPILLPSWITESHRIWQHGDDVDLDASVAAHRLPIFSGVTLCTTGMTQIVRRTKVNKLLTAAGGSYVKALQRPVQVTHLLCASDTETEEMKYADKFNAAGEADPPIKLVWEEWLWDSLEYGGRFDEAAYNARLPRPERKAPPVSAPQEQPPPNDQKPSRDTADDDEEWAPIQRLPSTTLQLWGSLLKTRGYQVAGNAVMLSPEKARQMVAQSRTQESTPEPDAPVGASGILSTFRRANSFAVIPRSTAAAARESSAGPSRLPFGRAGSTRNLDGQRDTPPPPLSGGNKSGLKDEDAAASAFTGLRFLLRGDADALSVRNALESAGGMAVSNGDTTDYIIVRLNSGSALYLAEPSAAVRAQYRTECWLERCLLVDRICPADEHPSFVPLSIDPLPIPSADKLLLSFSGLDVSDAHWVRRLLETLGIPIAPAFSRRVTHLLCPSGTGEKYTKAMQWGVPVIDMRWLEAVARTGSIPDAQAFLVGAPAAGDKTDSLPVVVPTPALENVATEERAVRPSSPVQNALTRTHSQSQRRGISVTPPKIPDYRKRALEDSIVSLLGKRPSPEEESSEFPAKRGRVYRSRRPDVVSSSVIVEEHQGSTSDDELNLGFEGGGRGQSADLDEQSLLVVYEDPGQRAEQERLATLMMVGGGDALPRTPNR